MITKKFLVERTHRRNITSWRLTGKWIFLTLKKAEHDLNNTEGSYSSSWHHILKTAKYFYCESSINTLYSPLGRSRNNASLSSTKSILIFEAFLPLKV